MTVFPTRVGVDLMTAPTGLRYIRFPHTRGGGPVSAGLAGLNSGVFPTRVGVDR